MTFEKLGIDVNKYRPDYYNEGKVSNFEGRELTYENLQSVQSLIINYGPTTYYKDVQYFMSGEEDGMYSLITSAVVSFTKEQVDNAATIGQIIDLSVNKPNGYRARTNYNKENIGESSSPIFIEIYILYFSLVTPLKGVPSCLTSINLPVSESRLTH